MDVKVLFCLSSFILIVEGLNFLDDEDDFAAESGSGTNTVADVSTPVPLSTTSFVNNTKSDKPREKGLVRYMTVGIAVAVMSVVILAAFSVCLVTIVKRKRLRQEKLAALNQHPSDPQCLVISNQAKTDQHGGYLTPSAEPNVYAQCK